jgi:effector-binding domain-containing protein
MIDTPEILHTAAQATAIIHLIVPRGEMRTVMGPGLDELLSTLRAQSIVPGGPWFTHYLRIEGAIFDFEIGVPVAEPVAAAGRVTNGVLPAATVARTIYHGSYEGLPVAWSEFNAWIKAQGRTAGPSLWQMYVTDPKEHPDPATWRTELTRPLAT